MTISTPDKPQLGDLVMDWENDLGVISHIERDEHGALYLYFVLWTSGGMQGYSTAHKLKEIESWKRNLELSS